MFYITGHNYFIHENLPNGSCKFFNLDLHLNLNEKLAIIKISLIRDLSEETFLETSV